MTEHERGLKINYEAIRNVLVYHAPYWVYRMDEIWEITKGTFVDPESKCKCEDHKLQGGQPCWMPPFRLSFLKSNKWVEAIPVKFNYCPECGRKLQPHEQR